MNPPRTTTLTESLRWHLRHADQATYAISLEIGVHHASLYRFKDGTRNLSPDAMDRLAKQLKLRLIRA